MAMYHYEDLDNWKDEGKVRDADKDRNEERARDAGDVEYAIEGKENAKNTNQIKKTRKRKNTAEEPVKAEEQKKEPEQPKVKGKPGRKYTEIDEVQFEKLCNLQCTLLEIASWFHCSDDTIVRWCKRTYNKNFEEVFEEYKGVGKIALRRTQMKLAETSPQMAIWLGKQMLGQRDIKNYDVKGQLPIVITGGDALED